MLLEFALEPSLLSNWDRFQRLVSLFGVAHGRLISRFPKKWQQLVLNSATCGPVEKARIEEALRRRLDDRLLPRYHEWRDDLSWIANAVAEHGKRPFHAILAAASQVGHDFVVNAVDLDVTALPPQVRTGPSRLVVRSAAEMAAAVRVLLQFSKKVLFVDRHFSPAAPRFRAPLAGMLLACLDAFGRARPVEVELHLGHRVLDDAADFRASCAAWLQDIIPTGMRVTVVRWNHEDLHNRYILTDRGGIQIGEGLDEARDDASRTDDVLGLLASETVRELMERYCGTTGLAKQLLRHPIAGKCMTHGPSC
jgi:hypothetical protein